MVKVQCGFAIYACSLSEPLSAMFILSTVLVLTSAYWYETA